MHSSAPSYMLKKDEKEKLVEKIGFMKPIEISEEMEMLRKHFSQAISFPTEFSRKLFDTEIGPLNDELASIRDEEEE